MTLTAGARLGVYEVITQIGAGGMGEVYRATDTRLKRQVAIKILPPSVAVDHDRLARFRREAEVLASLNHPHIAGVYGLEETAGVSALVMELVEGEDLSQRIARGAIPIDEALPIAKQIAEALEAAHEQGIIHRDLKPANIKVRSDGTVKVLDFGLAKAIDVVSGGSGAAGGPGGLSMSPTLTTPAMTQAGMILGTAAYMAPEQARGKAVDKRADIWAFGVVVFEMLTGRRAFDDEDVSMTLSMVLQREPDFAALPRTVPARITQAIRVCLRKDPRQRAGDIRDVRLALDGAFETSPAPTNPDSHIAAPIPRWRRTLPWTVAAAAILAAAMALWAPWRAEAPLDRPLIRLDVDLGPDVSLPALSASGSSIIISPDGTRLAYLAGTPPKLFTRRLDQPKSTELPGTQRANVPFFSPDGQWVGFFRSGMVNKISVEGGAIVPLGPIGPSTAGATWGEDGNILVSESYGGNGLKRIPAGGGPPAPVAALVNGEAALAFPQILPSGRAILFAADPGQGVDKTTIEVLTLSDGRRKIVARGGNSPRYLPTSGRTGHLVYVNKTALFAVPFDPDRVETRGTAVPVLDDIASEARYGTAHFDVSRTGTLVYRRSGAATSATTTVQWLDPSGKIEPLRAQPGEYYDPSVSPDGTRIAMRVQGAAGRDIWVYDPKRDAMTRLTYGGGTYQSPQWSPDGRYVVFEGFPRGILSTRSDGSSQPAPLIQDKSNQLVPWSFTPDGKRLAYFERAETYYQLWTVPLEDHGTQLKAGTPEPFLKSSFNDATPSFSPDGRWLAYASTESGRSEVYVRAFPPPSSGLGRKWQISNSGGTTPRWSRSGHELLYQRGDQIMAASYTVQGDTLVPDKPRVWIAKLGAAASSPAPWDLSADGKRVAVVAPLESANAIRPEHEIAFLENFFDELRRRVPLGK